MPTSLVKIAWHELKEISSCATMSLMIILQTALTKSCNVGVTSFMFSEGHPEHSSVSVNVRPPLKQQKHLEMCVWIMGSLKMQF